jgi:hypothetical protein
MFAAIPLVFAAQQAAEGVVWLTIDSSDFALIQRLAVGAFLGIALIVWPMWLPFSLQLIERNSTRRRVLTAMFWFGAAIAACALVLLTHAKPFAIVSGHSIRYDRAGSVAGMLEGLVLLSYVIPTIAPLFVSTATLARTIGVMLAGSLIASVFVERNALTSVWCFFAAALSGVIWIAVVRTEKSRAGLQTLGENPAI